jgi:hypothetical protein
MKCINPAQVQMMKGNRDFYSVAPNTTEITSIQISSNARTATLVTDGIFFALNFPHMKYGKVLVSCQEKRLFLADCNFLELLMTKKRNFSENKIFVCHAPPLLMFF